MQTDVPPRLHRFRLFGPWRRQDVAAFNRFLAQTAAAEQVDAELVGAKLVGRYRGGFPPRAHAR
jgi:hypothetical protein